MHDVRSLVVGVAGALACLVGMTPAAGAQTRAHDLPSIGLPLPRIGLPHPPMGLPPLESAGTQPAHRAPVPSRGRAQRGAFPPVVLLPPNFWFLPVAAAAPIASPPGPREATRNAAGTLRLDVTPAVPMQIFVDGYYIGTTDELGTSLELEAGRRRLELRAPGYEPLAFGARIDSDRTLTYRETLRRREESALSATSPSVPNAARPAAPAQPMMLYVIPGCYAGNVPPAAATLPAGCDVSGVQQLR